MGSYSSKQAHHDHNNVEGRVYAPFKETGESNGIDSRNSSCITQSHIDHGNKIEFTTSHNRITSPSGVSCHETNPNQSFKENGDSRKTNPKGCEIESHPPPDVLDGQQSCIEPSLPVVKPENQSSSDVPSTLDNDHEPQNNGIEQTDNRNESPSHEADYYVEDTYKKKQKQPKSKKKKRGTAERFSSKRKVGLLRNDANPSSAMPTELCNDSEGKSSSRRPRSADLRVPNDIKDESMHNEDTHAEKVVSLVQNDEHSSAVTSVEVFNDSDRKSSSRRADTLNRSMKTDDSKKKEDNHTIRMVNSASNETQHSTDTREEVANDSDGTASTKQDRPSSAVLFLASSLRTKQNEDDIIRQEQDMKIQAMTREAERLEKICKDHRSKHRNLKNDNSLCPPAFLQSMEHIEKCLDTLRKQIDELIIEKNGYLNRLSSVAGSMLTQKTTQI
ncbi:unnamed protein product [Mytilus edulis]|uniref:Uncharacterized protein n=1 Tax=Mytilus edulis TaxID=6550 RepID=A0A8S3QKD9_MYTED|nr:unnamed protein product [Mytilus edulis]